MILEVYFLYLDRSILYRSAIISPYLPATFLTFSSIAQLTSSHCELQALASGLHHKAHLRWIYKLIKIQLKTLRVVFTVDFRLTIRRLNNMNRPMAHHIHFSWTIRPIAGFCRTSKFITWRPLLFTNQIKLRTITFQSAGLRISKMKGTVWSKQIIPVEPLPHQLNENTILFLRQ